MRTCKDCGIEKPLEEFRPIKRWRSRSCKLCIQTRMAQNQRRYQLKRYGLTVEDFDRMVGKQAGRCGGCKQPSKLHVDHDHQTGQVRGLLCGPCNRALGILGEDPRRMAGLITYLLRTNGLGHVMMRRAA